MATGMHMDERSVDCLVLGHHDQDRKVSAKSVTMTAMTLCKNLSGYRELLLKFINRFVTKGLIQLTPSLGNQVYSSTIYKYSFQILLCRRT